MLLIAVRYFIASLRDRSRILGSVVRFAEECGEGGGVLFICFLKFHMKIKYLGSTEPPNPLWLRHCSISFGFLRDYKVWNTQVVAGNFRD